MVLGEARQEWPKKKRKEVKKNTGAINRRKNYWKKIKLKFDIKNAKQKHTQKNKDIKERPIMKKGKRKDENIKE